ncbi:MAG: twin-arginine translocase subunit TatC [Bacteroidota bacterium]
MGAITRLKDLRNGQQPKPAKGEEKEMSFLDHLEELRWHLIRAVVAIVIMAVVIFGNMQWIMEHIVLAPLEPDFWLNRLINEFRGIETATQVDMQAIKPAEQFLKALGISVIGGFIVTFPYVLWEIWIFIKPGLHKNERRGLRGNVFVMSFLFFLGISFAYYIITPFAMQFFANFKLYETIENQWRIGDYISMVTQIVMGGGLIFEMPILVFYLARMGVLTPQVMRAYRRHAIVVLLILAAIITPPDWITQILIFIPLTALYEISILICASVTRKREAELA